MANIVCFCRARDVYSGASSRQHTKNATKCIDTPLIFAYVRVALRPSASAPVALPLYATVVTAPDTPSLRYTRYVVTFDPVVTFGALHCSVTLVVFCAILAASC